MADNFQGTDFSGAAVTLASEDIGGVQHPKTVIADPVTGAPQDLTALLVELSLRIAKLTDNVGILSPDTSGRLRVNAEAGGTISTVTGVTTVSTVTTVTTVSTLTNQAQMGGLSTAAYMNYMSLMAEDNLRRNVVIT